MRKLLYLTPLLLAAAIFGALQIANSSEPDPPSAPSFAAAASPSPTPLDIEAEFKRLYELGLQAVIRRDKSALELAFTEDGSAHRRSEKAIDALRRDDVVDNTEVRVTKVKVLDRSTRDASLLVTEVLRPCFRDEQGKDVTTGNRSVQHVTSWVLRLVEDGWRLHAGTLRQAKAIDEAAARCPR